MDELNVNVLLSDDGLTHYALGRNIEIIMVDHSRLFGNLQCLPDGPLREPINKVHNVDFTVITGGNDLDHYYILYQE